MLDHFDDVHVLASCTLILPPLEVTSKSLPVFVQFLSDELVPLDNYSK